MQRQSLGSPSPILSPNTNTINNLFSGQEEEKKLKRNATITAETYIHVIPMLTLFCILILYLSSHSPSQNDMAQFDSFNNLHNDAELGELERKVENKRVAVIRSLKNINKKGDEIKNRRLNRKIGNI